MCAFAREGLEVCFPRKNFCLLDAVGSLLRPFLAQSGTLPAVLSMFDSTYSGLFRRPKTIQIAVAETTIPFQLFV